MSYTIVPKIIPVSVDETLIDAVALTKSRGPTVNVAGRSMSLRSPSVASSSDRPWVELPEQDVVGLNKALIGY
jgi:hypothetical protein